MSRRAEKAAYGFKFRAHVPKNTGKPKLCTRCTLWFAAQPRERVCEGCLRPAERAARIVRAVTHTTTPTPANDRQYPQVRLAIGGRVPPLTLECARDWLREQFDKGLEVPQKEYE